MTSQWKKRKLERISPESLLRILSWVQLWKNCGTNGPKATNFKSRHLRRRWFWHVKRKNGKCLIKMFLTISFQFVDNYIWPDMFSLWRCVSVCVSFFHFWDIIHPSSTCNNKKFRSAVSIFLDSKLHSLIFRSCANFASTILAQMPHQKKRLTS